MEATTAPGPSPLPARTRSTGGTTLTPDSAPSPPSSAPPEGNDVLNPHRTVSGGAVNDWMLSHPVFATKARGIRLRVLRFTSSWFSVTMGTGIVNTLLFDLPFSRPHAAFRALGAAFLLFDIVLFACFTLLTVARYVLYPKIFWAMIKHETHSLFLGCIPMGFVTIVSGIAATGHENGLNTLDAALVLYWISVAMSILTAFGVPYFMFTHHSNRAETMTAAWLLPIVPLITEAAVGSTLCKLLLAASPPRTSYCLTLMIASYLQGGIGVLLASAIIVMYLQRLVLHHLPPREVIGRVAVKLFPLISSETVKPELQILGPAMYGAAVVTGLLLWGLGIWFAFLAVVSITTQLSRARRNPGEGRLAVFNMGWWAFTFPLGSLTLLTFSLAETFDSMFFKVCSAIFTFSVLLLWIVVFLPTAIGFFRGTLFAAPCLQSLPKEYVEKMRGESRAPSRMDSEEEHSLPAFIHRPRYGNHSPLAPAHDPTRRMPEDTPRDELLPKSNRKFTLHFDDSLRLYLTETVRFPEPAAREQVGLLRGRLEAWLTYAYNKKLFIPYSVWEVKAVWGHLFDLGGNRRPENWTDNIHLVLTPVVEHKLARREWHQRLRLFKGATGMPTMYAIDGSTLHAHKRGFDPMKWMVVKSLQGVTINNPLANYIGLNAASFVRRSKRKQLCGRYFTFTDTFLEINLLYPGPSPSYYAGKPLRDYVTLENGTTYWQLRPVLDTRMVNTLSRMAAAQWLAPSGELSRGRQHPAPGALDIVCTFSGTELPSPTHSRAGGEAGGTSGPNPPPYFPTVDSAPGPTYRTDRRVVDVHGGGCEIVGKGTGEFRVDWAEVGSFFLGVMETSRIVLDVFQSMGRLMG